MCDHQAAKGERRPKPQRRYHTQPASRTGMEWALRHVSRSRAAARAAPTQRIAQDRTFHLCPLCYGATAGDAASYMSACP
eukprot:12883964-Prorocentrum_lima.AAC.1